MEIIDNINQLLGDNLKKTITPGSKLRIAASCFSIYAFEALKAELEPVSYTHLDVYKRQVLPPVAELRCL